MRRLLAIVAGFALVAGLAGPARSETKSIRIGGVGPLSAPGAVVGGIAMQWAMNEAITDINNQGGLLGKKAALVFGDTEGLPERGQAVAERLITEDKVVGIVGEYHSPVALAEAEVAHKYGVPILFSETWADNITETGYPEVFRIAPAASMVSRNTVDWMAAAGVKRVVLIAETSDFGNSMAQAQAKLLKEKGIKLLDTIYIKTGTSDFSPILTRIKAMSPAPDAVSAQAVTGETSYNLARQMVEMGIAPTRTTLGITNQVAIAPQFWQSVPKGAYFIFTNNGLPPVLWNPTYKRVAADYQKVFKSVIPSYALEAYDSVWVLADAIKRAGSTDHKAVIAALEKTDVDLAQGHYWFKYGSTHPLPPNVAKYMWHQWPNPPLLILQYSKPGQPGAEADVLWPAKYKTISKGQAYLPYKVTE